RLLPLSASGRGLGGGVCGNLLASGAENGHTHFHPIEQYCWSRAGEEAAHGLHAGGLSGPDAAGSKKRRGGGGGTLRELSRAHSPRCPPAAASSAPQPL